MKTQEIKEIFEELGYREVPDVSIVGKEEGGLTVLKIGKEHPTKWFFGGTGRCIYHIANLLFQEADKLDMETMIEIFGDIVGKPPKNMSRLDWHRGLIKDMGILQFVEEYMFKTQTYIDSYLAMDTEAFDKDLSDVNINNRWHEGDTYIEFNDTFWAFRRE